MRERRKGELVQGALNKTNQRAQQIMVTKNTMG